MNTQEPHGGDQRRWHYSPSTRPSSADEVLVGEYLIGITRGNSRAAAHRTAVCHFCTRLIASAVYTTTADTYTFVAHSPPTTTSSAGVGLRTYCRSGDFSSAACTVPRCGHHHEACATARHHRSLGRSRIAECHAAGQLVAKPGHAAGTTAEALAAGAVGLLASTCMQLADQEADNLGLATRCATAWESPITPPQAGSGRLWFRGCGRSCAEGLCIRRTNRRTVTNVAF